MIARQGLIFSTQCYAAASRVRFVTELRRVLDKLPVSHRLAALADLGWKQHELRYFGQELYTIDGNWVLTRANVTSGFTFLGEHLITCQQYKEFVEAALPGITVKRSNVYMNQFMAELEAPQGMTRAHAEAVFEDNTGSKFNQPLSQKAESIIQYGLGKKDGRSFLVAKPISSLLAD